MKSSAPPPPASGRPVRLLVSKCLLGERVRYDGQHKYDPFVVEALGRFVEWERVCPEVDSGMPTPRPSMRLVGDPAAPRLINRNGEDLTGQMLDFVERRLEELQSVELCGYVCKKDSPNSGMVRVKVYDEKGNAARSGAGLFTAAFLRRFPLVPTEEEGRLHDPRLRESFVERVFCRRRWLDLLAGGRSRGALVEFHADHKFLLLSHGREGYAELGRLVAAAKRYRTDELFTVYEKGFMAQLARPTTGKKVADVLMHMAGFFKKALTAGEKQELLSIIDEYRRGLVPVAVPLVLLRHYVRKYDEPYLKRQVFLAPYPGELMLRNFV